MVSSSVKLDHFVTPWPHLGILPAPNGVHYIEDPAGHLKILWESPTLFSDEFDTQNVSINLKRDARITHYIIYITIEESTVVYTASGTYFIFENDNIPCSLSFQVAAVNPAGVGEHSPLQNLTVDCEFA